MKQKDMSLILNENKTLMQDRLVQMKERLVQLISEADVSAESIARMTTLGAAELTNITDSRSALENGRKQVDLLMNSVATWTIGVTIINIIDHY